MTIVWLVQRTHTIRGALLPRPTLWGPVVAPSAVSAVNRFLAMSGSKLSARYYDAVPLFRSPT